MSDPRVLHERLGDFASDDGLGFVFDEAYYDDLTGLLQVGILGFCGCGRPEENLEYVLGALELVGEDRPSTTDSIEQWREWFGGYRKRVDEFFKSAEAEYFMWYWLDDSGYVDHGSSVPGWLTSEGRKLLNLLREWKALPVGDDDDA